MEYKIIPSRINDIEPTESEVKWENIVKKSKCKTCMHFRKCKHIPKNGKACFDYDELIKNCGA